jgi:murein DD-endopeptidase MepM/ murein hydrolase activator NlpD
MPKTKYRYNPVTCKYEPWYLRGRDLWKRTLLFLVTSFSLATAGAIWFTQQIGSIDEILLSRRNQSLKHDWEVLEKHLAISEEKLSALVDKDDNSYRVILDIEPLHENVRNAGIGGNEKLDMTEIGQHELLKTNYLRLEKLKHQLDIEKQSFEQLEAMTDDKIRMWASRPAIQPINNKQLNRLHMTYGTRLHPIFNIIRDHKGLDFAASKGTPVYATGDGKVEMAYYSSTFGNVIYLNHGYGYETRYAHLSKFGVTQGQKVKRGQVIGYVGNTGTSVSDHLHYEVLFHGNHVHPINFFQRDLSNKEYERLLEIGNQQSHPLD